MSGPSVAVISTRQAHREEIKLILLYPEHVAKEELHVGHWKALEEAKVCKTQKLTEIFFIRSTRQKHMIKFWI